MSFTPTEIIFAAPGANLANVAEARGKYGIWLPFRPLEKNGEGIITLLGHKDREGSEDLRAGVLGTTVMGTELTNGMVAFRGHFTNSFVSALGVDPLLDGCQILTEEQFTSLLPKSL